jgi:DedD protein
MLRETRVADTQEPGTAANDAFHEIHLSGKQLVFLFMATTVVSVVIFLCGVMVGRGVPAQQSQEPFTDPPTSAAAAPAQTQPVADAPAPPAETPSSPAEDLSYKKRLEAPETAAESLKPNPQLPVAAARPQSRPATASKAPAPQPVVGSAQPGTWVIQVHALRDRDVANGIVQRLVKKGYPAFVVAAGSPTGVYRVHVGRFKDRNEAERVVERLKKEEQFNPWITR